MKRGVIALFKSIDKARSTKIMLENINIMDKDATIILKEDPEEDLKSLINYGFTKEDLIDIDMGFRNADNLIAIKPIENYQEVNKFLVINGADSTFIAPEINYNNSKINDPNSSNHTIQDNQKINNNFSVSQEDINSKDDILTLSQEKLNISKDQINSEVVLRKEIVEELKTIQVPVSKEIIVVEKIGPDSTTEEIMRIPVAEERVKVDKVKFINEEVNVKKIQTTENRVISDTLKKEILNISKIDNT